MSIDSKTEDRKKRYSIKRTSVNQKKKTIYLHSNDRRRLKKIVQEKNNSTSIHSTIKMPQKSIHIRDRVMNFFSKKHKNHQSVKFSKSNYIRERVMDFFSEKFKKHQQISKQNYFRDRPVNSFAEDSRFVSRKHRRLQTINRDEYETSKNHIRNRAVDFFANDFRFVSKKQKRLQTINREKSSRKKYERKSKYDRHDK